MRSKRQNTNKTNNMIPAFLYPCQHSLSPTPLTKDSGHAEFTCFYCEVVLEHTETTLFDSDEWMSEDNFQFLQSNNSNSFLHSYPEAVLALPVRTGCGSGGPYLVCSSHTVSKWDKLWFCSGICARKFLVKKWDIAYSLLSWLCHLSIESAVSPFPVFRS